MNLPHIATDYKKAQELAEKADELRIRIDELYGKWEEAENRLSALVSDL